MTPYPDSPDLSPTDLIVGKLTITVPEAARVLGIGRDAAYRAAERGEIPTLKLGRRIMVPVPRLQAMLGLAVSNDVAAANQQPSDNAVHLRQRIDTPPLHGTSASGGRAQ